MAKNFGEYEIKDIVKLCLIDMEMPLDLDGYKYLVFGITFLYANPDSMITKHVYPAIAREFNCRSTHVEVAIRRAIEATWKCSNDRWMDYFPKKRRLTNGEFISTMVEVIAFWDLCRKNLVEEGVGSRD